MNILFHKRFVKQYKKLSPKLIKKLEETIRIFVNDPYEKSLNNHALHGKYSGYRSIRVTGDIRVVYKFINKTNVIFTHCGSHSSLYK